MTQLIYSPQKAAEIAVTGDKDIKVGIMFGRERNGLSNEEIAVADSIITIASFKSFSSLNLAQAVNIVSYEMHNRALNLLDEAPQETRIQPREGGKLASRAALEFFFRRLEDSLDKVNYQPHARRKELAYMNIRNIFQRVTNVHNLFVWVPIAMCFIS